jgi:acetyl esterase
MPPPSTFMIEDLEYRVIDGKPLLARLYRPADGAGALIVEVHGGAWTQNDRTTNAPIHEHLAAGGVAVLALDFRLAPLHRYPAAINDVNYGIRWAKANAARLGLKPRLVGGLGTSSGAHQITLSALRPDDERYLTHEPSLAGHDARLDFLVAGWPILDPLARYQMVKAKGARNLVDAHHAFWPDERAMAEGNPQLILERGEATALPPMLVLQGTADENVEHERADAFADRYRRAGGEIELLKFAGQPHTFIVRDPAAPASIEALSKISGFVQSRLRGTSAGAGSHCGAQR